MDSQNSELVWHQPIHLKIRGVDNIVSFKNSKMICAPKGRRPMLITDPRKKKQMEAISLSIVSQLRSEFQIRGIATGTECLPPSLMRQLMPLDDSRHWIPSIRVEFEEVAQGEEGADITIERIK